MYPILVTMGDPAGIGPDICLDIIKYQFSQEIVVIGDANVLKSRNAILNKDVQVEVIVVDDLLDLKPSTKLKVLHIDCPSSVVAGVLNLENSVYVLKTLDWAIELCKRNLANSIVTAPVNKEVINQSGIKFLGHTEYLAQKFGIDKVVMMLVNRNMKVALLTTHLPLKDVALQVTYDNLNQTIKIIIDYFKEKYKISNPKIAVCGLNPHAGDGGYLGLEEIEVINPVINEWITKGYNISGSHSADSIFLDAGKYNVILAMYHDQGLPVLKYSGFESGVNVTLGLPIIRTSVDHGTAVNLSGTGLANSESLIHAIKFAININGVC